MSQLAVRRCATTVVAGAILIALSACGGKEEAAPTNTSPSAASKVDAINQSLPDDVKSSGVITAATANDYPPFEFLDESNNLVGADIDFSKALGEIMGVEIKNEVTPFSGIVTGLASGRYDVGISSIGDYTSRQESVDFVDYYQGGTSFLIRAGDPEPKSETDVCGTAVGVLKGTASEAMAEDTGKKCVDDGNKPVDIMAFPTQDGAILALTSKRVDSVAGDAATNGYSAKQVGPSLQNVGLTVYNDRPYYGIALPKGSALYDPFMAAMTELFESGQYKAILDKWGIQDGAIDAPTKNNGTKD
ncbi:ABC transporter substrate-binding protein [soil metagenome]